MKKVVLTYGLISGAIISILMFGTLPFAGRIGFDKAQVVGYTTMVLSFLFVFFGIRSYRENVGDGRIAFKRAFLVGILIVLIACVFYVVTWEILYFKLMPDFAEKYTSYMLESMKASGATQQAIDAQVQQMQRVKVWLDNPLISAAIAFIEVFPVGLVMTLISSAILRKK
jgi:hypothetical protein